MKRILDWIVERLIARAMRTPYRKGHLLHADGSAYMLRYGLFETRLLSARVHKICTPDWDRHLHDHPWSFVSLVLRGGYLESRPQTLEPCFDRDGAEDTDELFRLAGSVAFRRATDRHLISSVLDETWTLVIYGPKRHWWGFFTPAGKVHWEDYASVHAPRRFP